MIRFFVSLFTAFASLVGLLGFSDSTMAAPLVDVNNNNVVEQAVNLNQVGSLWQLENQDTQDFFAHLGCNCAVCTGAGETEVEL